MTTELLEPTTETHSLSAAAVLPNRKSWVQRCASGLEWLFGLVSMIALLAACSVVPGLNFLSLGYLLHVSGRVAATGRLRDGFPGVRTAAKLGGILLGIWLIIWPARLLSGLWRDAELVAPHGHIARLCYAGLIIVMVLTALQILWALVRGGRLRYFFWPQPAALLKWLRGSGKVQWLQSLAPDAAAGLQLPYLFWLGLRGFAGAFLWLIVPVSLLLAAVKLPVGGAVLLSVSGGLLLAMVAVLLPFLQTRLAVTQRFNAMFEVGAVKQMFTRAPMAFWLALLTSLLFALPLYVLKVELTPRELAWLPSIVFVLFILPARLLTGWALGRAMRHEAPRHWTAKWAARLLILPVALAYALMVYLAPYFSWNGAYSLLEQHAFLVPAPLMAL